MAKSIVPTEEHNSMPLYSHEAGRPAMRKAGERLLTEFPEPEHRSRGVFISVGVRLPRGSAEALFTITIDNRIPYRVHEMWFSWIGGTRCAEGTKDMVTTTKRRGHNPCPVVQKRAEETDTCGRHTRRRGDDGMCVLPMASG